MKTYRKLFLIPALFAFGMFFMQNLNAQAPAESNTKVSTSAAKHGCNPAACAKTCTGKASATATGNSTAAPAKHTGCSGAYKTASYSNTGCSGAKKTACATPGCQKACCAGAAKGTATGASK